MKKTLFLFAAILASTSAFAQFGIVGGLTSSSSNIRTAANELKTKSINQYHVGIAYKFPIGKILAIQPSLIYNVKGAAIKDIGGISDVNFKTGYIELPIPFQIGITLGKLLRIYGIAEPFVGYAITNSYSKGDIRVENWDNVLNRFEIGAGLGAGIELFRHVQVNIKYFWNFGSIYGKELTFDSFKKTLQDSKCGGISLTGAILF